MAGDRAERTAYVVVPRGEVLVEDARARPRHLVLNAIEVGGDARNSSDVDDTADAGF